jgi:hypothetical protein
MRKSSYKVEGATMVIATVMGGRRGRMGSTLTRDALFTVGSTQSAHCGSFHHTTCTTTAISRQFREKIMPIYSPDEQVTTLAPSLGRQTHHCHQVILMIANHHKVDKPPCHINLGL